ncbi:hypothetical protein [Neoaquamicrobium sediminum]|uniref:LPXTG cell wall anchor domain-containing protein n=1 Tax=Neoaquamicrobium sediminum TaxID=1849104 RepID=A0ABV3WSQ9_9HYPH
MRWVFRLLFMLMLVAGVVLGIVYPRVLVGSGGDEIGRWRIYERGTGERTVETVLDISREVAVGAELRTEDALPDDLRLATLTVVVRDADENVVLREGLALSGAAVLESPQSQVRLYRAAAGILNGAEGAYRFDIEVADDVGPSLLSVDLVLRTVAASPDPRMQPAGFVLMAVGVVGFLLTFRRRRENPNSKPPKWGRV